MSDTSAEVEARYWVMVLARPPGGERLKIASEMFNTARQLLIAAIRAARPEMTEVELRQELFLRYYGEEFNPEQRERILNAIASYWARHQVSQQPERRPRTRDSQDV